MEELHTDDDFDLLLALARPLTPDEEARAEARRADFAAYLDTLGLPEHATRVRRTATA
ncbi:MAG TPA: hypothetical protein VF594_09335 [Rubricoccaceae bacterium]|jgi:hypothetical protein